MCYFLQTKLQILGVWYSTPPHCAAYNIVVNINQTSLPTRPHFAHDTASQGWMAYVTATAVRVNKYSLAAVRFSEEIFQTSSEKPNRMQLTLPI